MNDVTKQMLKSFLQGQGKLWGAAAASYLVSKHIIDPSMGGLFGDLVAAGILAAGVMFWSWWGASGRALLEVHIKKLTGTTTVADAVKVANELPATPPASVQAVAASVVKACLALMFVVMLISSASAAGKITGDFAKDFPNAKTVGILAATPPADPFADLMAQIEKVKSDVVTGVIAALNEADKDAATLTNPSDPTSFNDPISHACYPAQVKFLQSLPVSLPITSPAPYNLIVLFQRKRDFVAQIKAGVPVYLKLGCVPLLGDEAQTFLQTAAMVGIKLAPAAATAMFPAIAPITLPAMNLGL